MAQKPARNTVEQFGHLMSTPEVQVMEQLEARIIAWTRQLKKLKQERQSLRNTLWHRQKQHIINPGDANLRLRRRLRSQDYV